MTASLSSLPLRSKAIIKSYLDESIACRMISLGLLPEQEVEILRFSPFNDAIYLRYGAAQLAMRVSEANQVLVSRVP